MNSTNTPILIFKTDDDQVSINVNFTDETTWLTQRQIVELFQSSKATVSEHVKNIYADEELLPEATVRVFRTV